MHQVHRRVGLQKIAPGALTGMRLARYQQHPQAVAHAVDDDGRTVVAQRQFFRSGRRFDLDNAETGVIQHQRNVFVTANAEVVLFGRVAVAPDADAGGAAGLGPAILDTQDQRQSAVDHAVGRGLAHHQAPVAHLAAAADQAVHRSGHISGAVVDLPVGNENRARDAVGGYVGQGFAGRAEQFRALIVVEPPARLAGSGFNDADLQAVQRLQARLQGLKCCVGGGAPVLDVLAGRAVDDDRGDVLERLAAFLNERRVGQGDEGGGDGDGSEAAARHPADPAVAQQQRRHRAHQGDQRPRQQRREGDVGDRHCPSRSSKAGTCT